ncbi:hypothetical protein [Leucobacter chromiireducens]|uniref:Uncharacterized protein n=1 Tax=Leucobacter chromiireducens subsp. solipictus TaxID=398235 RepID=A0ABS1SDA0_9MICO|nr:hypothetical protein [Leucobacter chromiireducens]MBL3678514.1 hypothetical protein [Leucobacter chromiireducens subsp. solipictus]
MSTQPAQRPEPVEHFSPEPTPDPASLSSYWLTAAGAIVVAVLCFTPIWNEVADPNASGRRSGISHFLAAIGPFPIAAVAVAVAATAVILGFRARAARRSAATTSGEQ